MLKIIAMTTPSIWRSRILCEDLKLGAWSMLYAASKYNDPPKDGYEYILAKINFKLLDIKDGKSFWIYGSKLKLVSENGRVYDSCYASCPDPEFDATIYKGATIEGWAAYLVKKDDLHPKLSFGTNYDGTGGIWFRAYMEQITP